MLLLTKEVLLPETLNTILSAFQQIFHREEQSDTHCCSFLFVNTRGASLQLPHQGKERSKPKEAGGCEPSKLDDFVLYSSNLIGSFPFKGELNPTCLDEQIIVFICSKIVQSILVPPGCLQCFNRGIFKITCTHIHSKHRRCVTVTLRDTCNHFYRNTLSRHRRAPIFYYNKQNDNDQQYSCL